MSMGAGVTGDNPSPLPAGPDLDAMVSRLIFGRGWYQAPYIIINGNRTEGPRWIEDGYTPDQPGGGATAYQTPPPYSQNFASSWAVVYKMMDHFWWRIQSPFHPQDQDNAGKWTAGLTPHGVTGWNGRPDFQAIEETAPLAICRAALMAIVWLNED